MQNIRLCLFLTATILASALYGQPVHKAKLDSLFQAYQQHNRFMGTIAISKGGNILYQKSTGYLSLEGNKKRPAAPEAKYRIGSVSKTFTAAMIFQLIEEKKLSLDDKLATYYPSLPNAAKITIGMLLSHHSGLHSFTDSSYLTYNTIAKTHKEILDIISKYKPDFEPGENARYSNTNYVLLGYILEKVTHNDYSKELKKRIVEKAGLQNTFYGSKINLAKNEALSYKFKKEWKLQSETDMSIPGGAGAIVSTAADLNKFSFALFTGKLVLKESLDKMKEIKDGFGMGLFEYPFYDRVVYGHEGAIDGFNSSFSYFPTDSVGISIVSNGLNYKMNDIDIALMSILYNKRYNIPAFSDLTMTDEELKNYEGIYSSTQIPLKITIKNDEGTLTAQATGQSAFPLETISKTEFRFDPAGIIMTFSISKEKKISSFILKQGAGFYSFTKE